METAVKDWKGWLALAVSGCSFLVSLFFYLSDRSWKADQKVLRLEGYANSEVNLNVVVPNNYALSQGELYLPYAPTQQPPIRLLKRTTDHDLDDRFAYFEASIQNQIEAYRLKNGPEKINHTSIAVPVVAKLKYSFSGGVFNRTDVYNLHCYLTWSQATSPASPKLVITGFGPGYDPKPENVKESLEMANALWTKRLAELQTKLGGN